MSAVKAWLVVNSFVQSVKFRELYAFFQAAAEKTGVALSVRTTDSLICTVQDGFAGFDLPDFVLFWDKDTALAKRLEREGLPVFNSASAIEACDSKVLTALALAGKVPTPKTVLAPKTFEGVGYCRFEFLEKAADLLGFPMIIKEACGSFGQQVYLANDLTEAKKTVERIGYKDCLMQEFVASSRGRDVRINVVGGRVVASMLRYNDHDFRSNISNGGSMKPYTPAAEQIRAAEDACAALGLDFAGVDVLFGPDGAPLVCEVNSNPHFKTTYQCTGVDLSEQILRHIRRKCEK